MKRAKYLLPICVVAVAWCGGDSLIQKVPPGAAGRSNPMVSDPQAQRAGAKLYARECAACHGENREGRGKVPPLNGAEVYQSSPGALFWILRNGSLHTGMPSFAHLPEAQRWQIITWLRNRESQL